MKALGCCLIPLFFLSSTGYAAVYSATGVVSTLHSEGEEADWLALAGVTSLGTCKIADSGYVIFLIPKGKEGQRMFELALASKTSGVPLKIWVDDTVTRASGFCIVSVIE
jgi:hypothetical protein